MEIPELKNRGLILASLLAVEIAHLHAAAPRRAVSDDQIVIQGQLVGRGKYVEVYEHGVKIDPSFLKTLNDRKSLLK